MKPWQGEHGQRIQAVRERCTDYRILGKKTLMALLAVGWLAPSVIPRVIPSVIPSVIPRCLPELPGKSRSKNKSKSKSKSKGKSQQSHA